MKAATFLEARTRANAQSRATTTVRLGSEVLTRMEQIRDPQRFPTQSDFIREAVKRFVLEEKRRRVREQVAALVGNPEDVELSRAIVNAEIEALSARPESVERGE